MSVNVVDPRFFSALGPYFAQTGRIEAPTVVQDAASGEEIPTWAAVAGLEEVALAAGTSADETRLPGSTRIDNTRRVALAGYYPEVTPAMRLVMNGVAWAIRGVTADAASGSTWLAVERIQPSARS